MAGTTGHVAGSVKKTVWLAVIFAALWNAFIGLIIFVMVTHPNSVKSPQGPPLLFMIPFVLVGLGLAYWAIREWMQLAKYGDPAFDIDFVPVPPGGQLAGRITMSALPGVPPPFKLVVACVHRQVTGTGKNRTVTESVLYHAEQTTTALPGGIVPVAVDLPLDAQETNASNRDDAILWRLRVTADFPGVPFSEQYEFPVATPADIPPEQAIIISRAKVMHQMEVEHYQRPANSRIYVKTTPEGKTVFFFSAARNRGPIVFTVVALAAVVVIKVFVTSIIFSVVLLLIATLLGYALAQCLFGTTTVTVGPGEMEIRKDILGWNWSTTTIPASDVVEIETKVGMSMSGSNGNTTNFYDINVVCRDAEATAGSGMTDKLEAESLAEQMQKCLKRHS
jgi:hypothetical protein